MCVCVCARACVCAHARASGVLELLHSISVISVVWRVVVTAGVYRAASSPQAASLLQSAVLGISLLWRNIFLCKKLNFNYLIISCSVVIERDAEMSRFANCHDVLAAVEL